MNIIHLCKEVWHRRTGDAYLNYLRKKGIKVGRGTILHKPFSVSIDETRPELLTIGENVLLHKGLTILTHDYASRVFVNLWGEFIPSHGKVSIGNNVWFGQNCSVLKGTTIGDNCIIGYGSTVIKDIPANSVAVGTPAKVICTLEEYFHKRKKEYINEISEYAILKERVLGRDLVAEDLFDDYTPFVDATNMDNFKLPYSVVFTTKDTMQKFKINHKAEFSGFEEFMEYVHSKFGKAK